MNTVNEQVGLDSDFGQQIGFTSDKFNGWCWLVDKKFYISFIESKHQGQGHLRALIKNVLDRGYTVCVPTPFTRMRTILERLGFNTIYEETDMGPCEVMISPDKP